VHIAAELGKHLVETDADGNGDSQLLPGTPAQLRGNFHAAQWVVRHIQPAFVQAEGFDLVGVFAVEPAHHLGKMDVLVAVWGEKDQIGAFLLGFPQRFACFYAAALGCIAFCQHDTVPLRGIATYSDGLSAQLRIEYAFDRCVKIVTVAVQDCSHVRLRKRTNVLLLL